ncbi:MAG: hypothetical protein AAGH60_11895 [Pseudomonadota bacterium]
MTVLRLIVAAVVAAPLLLFAGPSVAAESFQGGLRVTKIGASATNNNLRVDLDQNLALGCNRTAVIAASSGRENIKDIVMTALLADRPVGISISDERVSGLCQITFADIQ